MHEPRIDTEAFRGVSHRLLARGAAGADGPHDLIDVRAAGEAGTPTTRPGPIDNSWMLDRREPLLEEAGDERRHRDPLRTSATCEAVPEIRCQAVRR